MATHLPSTAELECDECGDMVDVDLTEFAGDPESVGLADTDLPEGWTESCGCHYCPKEECQEASDG